MIFAGKFLSQLARQPNVQVHAGAWHRAVVVCMVPTLDSSGTGSSSRRGDNKNACLVDKLAFRGILTCLLSPVADQLVVLLCLVGNSVWGHGH